MLLIIQNALFNGVNIKGVTYRCYVTHVFKNKTKKNSNENLIHNDIDN